MMATQNTLADANTLVEQGWASLPVFVSNSGAHAYIGGGAAVLP